MSNINAELAKITVNCAVTMKISFANQLGAVCAKIPGADAHVILQAVGRDRRIGSHYFKPGLGYGGPCFPRDNQLFQYTARSVGAEAPLAAATDRINEGVNQRLLQTVLAHARPGQPVAVLGLAYKPYTNVIECSPGIWLCRELAARGFRVLAHDYAASNGASAVLAERGVQLCAEPGELFREGCRTFAITCPWPAYRDLFVPGTPPAGIAIIDPCGC
jgi:UDPglucose 6-dehydrogenase